MANLETRIVVCMSRCARSSSRGAGCRQNNDTSIDEPFLRFTEERSYTIRVTKIVAQYVGVFSNNLLVTNLDFVAFDMLFYQFYVYTNFG